jgi:PHD/YefM family antitoxin component YafN of YafNO toxin-antitoxin module
MAGVDASPQTREQDPDESFVRIQDMGSGSSVVRDVLRTGHLAVVTENGDEIAVIVDAATFRAMRDEMAMQRLRVDLDAAIAEADAGDLIEHADVMAEMDQLLKERAHQNHGASHHAGT